MPETTDDKLATALDGLAAEVRKRNNPSWAAYIAIALSLIASVVAIGRYTGSTDQSLSSQRELTDLKIKFNETEIERVRKDIERLETESAAKIKQLIDDVTLLRTRADNVDRRLSGGGIR